MAKTSAMTEVPVMELIVVTRIMSSVTRGEPCACSHVAIFASSTTISVWVATSHARLKKIAPAMSSAIHPAMARPRGERLWARGSGGRGIAPVGSMPSLAVVVEGLRAVHLESAILPCLPVDLDVAGRYAQHVEGIALAARARRQRRARLDDERRDPFD